MITELEFEVLKIVYMHECHDGCDPLNHPVWSDSWFTKAQTGAVSSCSKKGLVGTDGKGRDATIWITQAGMDAYFENRKEFAKVKTYRRHTPSGVQEFTKEI